MKKFIAILFLVFYVFNLKAQSDNKEIDKNIIVTNFTIPFNNKLTFKTDFYYERKLLPISIGEDSNRADISLGIQSVMMFQNDSFYKDTVYDKVSSIYIGPRASLHYHFF